MKIPRGSKAQEMELNAGPPLNYPEEFPLLRSKSAGMVQRDVTVRCGQVSCYIPIRMLWMI